jgi:hypothetical protein
MSMIDDLLVMCDSTAMPTDGTGVLLGDYLDFGTGGYDAFKTAKTPDWADGQPVYLVIKCEDQDFAGTEGAVVNIALRTSAETTLASGHTVLLTVVTDITPNDGDLIACVAVPQAAIKRYMGIWVDVDTQDLSAGKITAYLSLSPETSIARRK